MSNVTIEPLTKDNYDTWVIHAEAVLVQQELWKYVETPLTAVATAEEKQNDKLAKSELILIIAPSQLKHVKNCTTAKELWDKLKRVYASTGPARKASLLKQLILTKIEGSDVRGHLDRFMDIVDKLADMDVAIDEDLICIMMLNSLSHEHDNFRVAIESRDTLPKPEELKKKIIEESEARHSKRIVSNYDFEEKGISSCYKNCKRRYNIFKRRN